MNIPEKAISVRQPWAWAIIHARKGIENRPVNWKIRGPVAIHASQSMGKFDYYKARDFMLSIGVEDVPRPDELIRGTIIGAVDVIDCINDSEDPWFFGKYGLVLENPRPIEMNTLVSGQLGAFKWEATNLHLPDPSPWMKNWS